MMVAETIAKQMAGGVNKLRMMLGATLVGTENSLRIKWPNRTRSKGNVCIVTLDPSDTYTVEFFNQGGSAIKSVKRHEGVYCDQLKPIFETQTGWYLSL